MKKKPDLDFSRPFDAFWWLTIPEIKDSADFICQKIPMDKLSGFKKKRLKNTLKVILTNLHIAHEYDPKQYVALRWTIITIKNTKDTKICILNISM